MIDEKLIRESDTKRYLREQCFSRLGVKPRPLMPQGLNGIPDRIVPYRGVHLVECKRPVNGKVSECQKALIKEFNAGEALIWVLHDHDSVDAFINYLIAIYGPRL